jgi:hypothetical protein
MMMILQRFHIFKQPLCHLIGLNLSVCQPIIQDSEKQVGTWQLIPDIEAEDGDFSGQTKLLTTFNQVLEGMKHRFTFADDLVQNKTEINHKSTQNI